jgi:hypothetical protein
MPERSAHTLRRLSAELRAELLHIDRTVSETLALSLGNASERIALYATAALLDTFYTGIEKAFRRIAAEFGGVPQGSGWHRALLDDMALEIPKLRPAVLSEQTVRVLSRFLAFRHRFRNLYLFDLEAPPLVALVQELPPAWAASRGELGVFAEFMENLADRLE